ncbi:hypothetical protein EI555_013132 [Monodon monoceros]|uniref:Prostaglandin E synthase n=1 Tax=Monodon monoceros TaxID=40151 RepID=A0A4U1ET97_MONMO|nr:hypothetical protein EI555_013132 [Monodon monoceros]
MPPPGLELMSGRVLPAFLLCSTLLVIKMYVVAIITGQVRLRKKVRAALGDPSPACAPFSHRREGWGRDPWPRCFRGQSLSERARDQVPLPALWDGFSAALGFSGARTSFSSVLRAFTICCATRLLPTLRMLRDTEASSIAGATQMWNVVSGKAHRNDMETIYPFLFLGFVYSFLGPDPFVAWVHFLVVFLGRMVHTVAYLGKLRAPTRSLAYTLAQLPCASMALQIVWEAARHL